MKSIIPLPDPNAPPGSAAHVSSYQEFPSGSTVMALYPDTSCFYRAEVIATPKEMQPTGRVSESSCRTRVNANNGNADRTFLQVYADIQAQV